MFWAGETNEGVTFATLNGSEKQKQKKKKLLKTYDVETSINFLITVFIRLTALGAY